MLSIKIFDKDVNLLGIIDKYNYFKITRRFYNLSEFELELSLNTKYTDLLVKNNLLLLGKMYNKTCIILHREIVKTKKANKLTIKGCTLQGLMGRRIIVPSGANQYENHDGKQETIMKEFVKNNCVNATNTKRNIARLEIATDQGRGIGDAWRGSYEYISDKLAEIGQYAELGYNITLDKENRKFIFDVIQGKDLTVNQEVNPPVIFREDFDNILQTQYTESIINAKNAIYMGDAATLVLNKGDITDFERIEYFESGDTDTNDILNAEIDKKIKELEELKTFELEVSPYKNFIYEKDYDLGDNVTVQDRQIGLTMDTKIIEAEETYKKNLSVVLTFGTSIPTIMSKINGLERKVR